MQSETEIVAEVLVTRREYMELWKASPIRYLSWILALIGMFYFCWLALIFAEYGYTTETAFTILSFCFVSLFALFGAFIVPRIRTALAFRGPIFREPRVYTISEEGLRCESILFQGRYQWKAFTRVKETKYAFAFFVSPAAALLIPKRCIPTKEAAETVRDLVARHVRSPKQSR